MVVAPLQRLLSRAQLARRTCVYTVQCDLNFHHHLVLKNLENMNFKSSSYGNLQIGLYVLLHIKAVKQGSIIQAAPAPTV